MTTANDMEDLINYLVGGANSSPPMRDDQVMAAVDEFLMNAAGNKASVRLTLADALDARLPNTPVGAQYRKLVR